MIIDKYNKFVSEKLNFDKYDMILGKKIMLKYLSENKPKIKHSEAVANFAYRVAKKLKENGVDINPEFVGFLAYVHDIGYSVQPTKHEEFSVKLLTENESIPYNIARYAMHGQIYEQYEKSDKYLPVGLEGRILVYSDMSVNQDEPTSLESRAKEIKERVLDIPNISDELKNDIINCLDKGMPRFKSYEKEILELSGVQSYKDF